MNICFCLDKKYAKFLLKSLMTYQRFNKKAKFYFFCNDNIPWLKRFGKVIQYDSNLLKDFTKNLCGYTHVSVTCFSRFLIPMYLKDLDRALYVDCDTLCKKNLDDLYNLPMEDYYILACKGADISFKQAEELKLPWYINSGVLLFNISKMNQDNYFQQILDKWRECRDMPSTFSADETIINYVFHNKIKTIPEKYNYNYNRRYLDRTIPYSDISILHILGSDKKNFFLL